MAAEPLVRLESVTKEYRSAAVPVHALRDVTLSLPPGELCIVHGRSGSGKTTLLNMIGGLDRPSAGRVEVDGREISSLPEQALVEYRRETIGFVFQAFGLIPILTAAENVEVPLRLRRVEPEERATRVHDLLRLVVDSQRARTIMDLLRRLIDERGVSVIVATHDPLLIAMASQAVELSDGAVVAQEDGAPPATLAPS